MAPVADVVATLSPEGREQLRFSATVINTGDGALELRALRTGRDARFVVEQRLDDPLLGPRLRPTAARLVFAGDGHRHWHVRDLETYELRARDGRTVRRQAKRGFCFFDDRPFTRARPRPRPPARYTEARCGGPASRGLTMGLSPGWADRYAWSLPDQYIDVTGLAPGIYRLRLEADREDLFLERDEANNAAWVDVRLRRRGGVPVATVVPGTAGRA